MEGKRMMQSPKRRHRTLAVAGVVAATALTLAGCSSGANPASSGNALSIPAKDPTATVSILSYDALNTDGNQSVITAFEKAHPTIKIKWESVPSASLNGAVDADVSNKSGNPDIYLADQPRISALASRGEAEDLTSVFSKYKSTFTPAAYDSGLYKNKLYALPISNSTQLLYYNKDLLSKAGLPDPSPAVSARMTWEDIATDALKAHAGGAQYGFVFGQPTAYYQLEVLPVSLGGSVGASGPGNLTPDFTSPQWVKAFDWYGQLFKDGASPRGPKDVDSDPDFLAGKTAYMVEGPWLLSELQTSKINWGVAPQPKFAGGKAATPTGSWSLAMNPFSKEKAAAAIFMKWMAIDNGGGAIKYNTTSTSLPANISGEKYYFDSPMFKTPVGKDAKTIIDYEDANTAVNRVQTIGYIEFETILDQTFADISNGADAKTALESAKKQVVAAWAKYK
jgi:ABC-type glycerol-3-phosphate transport system substrate-binding protein